MASEADAGTLSRSAAVEAAGGSTPCSSPETLMRRLLVVLPCAVLASCVGLGDCTDELGISIKPTASTLAVGQTVSPTVRLSSCGGREHFTDAFTWRTADSAVVAVDSLSGRISARAPGVAHVEVRGARYGQLGEVVVTVR
jgi:Bacterial Ig-like domain (group 2)